ncbi:MerR family transcriptional regulator [Saprospira grandis]|uniref:Transcriptional regulator n=1 Tax=Saprospira grandis (strain Lewin) TaxID=984262 RepID=H6LA57_SAPGL|nr:MerR family transcriptional regulator [Saprospira grandis]AFC25525.1 transcriptional regulator [Saprospira grandis str. Lewin]WBM73549.1 MerR family transcriptional regulator [Saprospira grandis]
MKPKELAEKLDVSTATLRNWAREFAFFLGKKGRKATDYTEHGVQRMLVVKYLLHEKGFTVEGAKKEIHRRANLDQSHQQMIEKLEEIRHFLLGLQADLAAQEGQEKGI